MKKLYSTILVLATMVAALSITACSSSSDDDEDNGGGGSTQGEISRILDIQRVREFF